MQEAYNDALGQNAAYIDRYATQTITKILRQLERAEIRITAQIAAQIEGLSDAERAAFILASFKTRRLIALRESIQELARSYRQAAMNEIRPDGKELFMAQAEFHEELILRGIEITPLAATVTPSQAYVAAVAQPFNGGVLKQFGRNLETGVKRRVDQSLRTSFVNSDTLQESINAIRGTKALNYKDGVLDISRRGAAGLARSHFNHMSNRAALHSFRELGIEKLQYNAVLDGRTTQVCASLDLTVWSINDSKKRIPPQHFACRSIISAYLNDYEPKGFRPFVADDRSVSRIPKSERKDKVGRVRADTNFAKWFSRQDAGFQKNWLGASRYTLYKKGGLELKKFVDYRKGAARKFTIEQLKVQHSAIFERLGL